MLILSELGGGGELADRCLSRAVRVNSFTFVYLP